MDENNKPAVPQNPMENSKSQNSGQSDFTQINPDQPNFVQPGYSQPDFNGQNPGQPNYNQPNFNQPGYAQQSFNQQNPGQPNYNQPDFNQPGYAQQSFNQPGYAQQNYNQPNLNQPSYAQQSFNQPGYAQQNYNQPNLNQPGYSQPGYNQQNPGQPNYGQGSRESTYWENNASGRTNYGQTQASAPTGQWSGGEAMQQPQSQTPEQFYQYYQQQMGNSTGNQQSYSQPQTSRPAYQAGTAQKPPKKKHRGALVAVLVILILLLSAAGTAYAFRDTLMNSYTKMTRSPAEYYSYIEKNNIDEAAGEIASPSALPLMTSKPAAYEVTSDITFDRDTIDSLLQSSGMSLADIESMLGIQFNSIGVDAIVGTDGNIINETLGVRLNQINLITAELFMDSAAQKIFVRLPELSQAYLGLSPEDLSGSTDMSKLEEITPEKISELLKKYSYLIIDNVKQVELEENAELTLDTLSTKCTKVTVTITEEDALNMALAVLEEAREDEFILDLLPMMNMTVEEYQGYVDEAIAQCNASADPSSDETVQMVLYVNSKGEVLGRELSADGTDVTLGYTILSKGGYEEYKVFFTDEMGTPVINLEGSHTKSDGAYTGDASIEFNSPDQTLSNFSFDISYDNVRTETKNNRTYQYGTISVSSLDLMGLQVTIDYSVEDETQKCKLAVQMGAAKLISMDASIKYLDNYEVTMPPENAEVYDAVTDTESYLATFNIEDYISKLSEQLGVDLQSIFDSFMSGYDY